MATGEQPDRPGTPAGGAPEPPSGAPPGDREHDRRLMTRVAEMFRERRWRRRGRFERQEEDEKSED
jgi:hypothetical protein